MVHRMIHELKYRDNQEIGEKLGMLFALELFESKRMSQIDMLVPVPLHPRKEKMRGYNQCHAIARGMQQILNCEVDKNNLVRKSFTSSQTRKGRFERWQNVGTLFDVKNPALFENKRIMLVDDVITTGSTIEACAHVLKSIGGIKLMAGAIAFPV
jgi:ComF family protein